MHHEQTSKLGDGLGNMLGPSFHLRLAGAYQRSLRLKPLLDFPPRVGRKAALAQVLLHALPEHARHRKRQVTRNRLAPLRDIEQAHHGHRVIGIELLCSEDD